jgi:hypothetical protein
MPHQACSFDEQAFLAKIVWQIGARCAGQHIGIKDKYVGLKD